MPHALVTGASKGIGAALARQLGAAGYDVTLVARSEDKLNEVAAAIEGVQTQIIPFDLTAVDRVSELMEGVESIGPVDLLVNNAGMEKVASSVSIEPELIERVVAINLRMPLKLTRAVLPGMVERNRGAIVDICSVASYVHPPYQSIYSATKAGLAAFSKSLRAELKRTNVHVMTVYPGPIRTELGLRAAKATDAPADSVPWGTAEGLADKIMRGLDRKTKRIVYPTFYWIPKLIPGISQTVTDAQGANLTEEE